MEPPLRRRSTNARICVDVPFRVTTAIATTAAVKVAVTASVKVFEGNRLTESNGPRSVFFNRPLGSRSATATVRKNTPLRPRRAGSTATAIKVGRRAVLIQEINRVA